MIVGIAILTVFSLSFILGRPFLAAVIDGLIAMGSVWVIFLGCYSNPGTTLNGILADGLMPMMGLLGAFLGFLLGLWGRQFRLK